MALVAVETCDLDGCGSATRHYPSGKACDGDGYLSGQLTMTAKDRVRP